MSGACAAGTIPESSLLHVRLEPEILMDGLPYENCAHVQFTSYLSKQIHLVFLDQYMELMQKRCFSSLPGPDTSFLPSGVICF